MKCNNLAELLERFDNEIGISGFEASGTICATIKEEMDGFYDEFTQDALSNQIYLKKGMSDFKVMLAAHMDELGFIVTYIEPDGMIRFGPVGLHDDRGCIDQILRIHTKKGDISGVTGSKPSHILTADERSKVMMIADLFIDIGASSKEEALEMGVQPGDVISFTTQGRFLNGTKTYVGKSVDDRAGCAVMVEVMRRLKAEKIDNVNFYAVGTVMEEIGLRGAGTAAHNIKPDIAIALDVTLAYGPDTEPRQVPMQFGGGATIKIFDWCLQENFMCGSAVPRSITDKFFEIAKEHGIKCQPEILFGGTTDAYSISVSGDGVLTGAISFPSRYIHTAVGTVHLDDLQSAVDLMVEYIKTL